MTAIIIKIPMQKIYFNQAYNNLATLYSHLSKQIVKTGDIIKEEILSVIRQYWLFHWSASSFWRLLGAKHINEISSPANGLVPIGVVINPRIIYNGKILNLIKK